MCTRHHSEMLIQSVIAGLTRHDFASYNNVQLVREIHVIRRRTNELALFPSSKHLLQVRNGPSKKKNALQEYSTFTNYNTAAIYMGQNVREKLCNLCPKVEQCRWPSPSGDLCRVRRKDNVRR